MFAKNYSFCSSFRCIHKLDSFELLPKNIKKRILFSSFSAVSTSIFANTRTGSSTCRGAGGRAARAGAGRRGASAPPPPPSRPWLGLAKRKLDLRRTVSAFRVSAVSGSRILECILTCFDLVELWMIHHPSRKFFADGIALGRIFRYLHLLPSATLPLKVASARSYLQLLR